MALLSDKLKSCGVKIDVRIGEVPSFGSGVIYSTPPYVNYNYILTAKHNFQEDQNTSIDLNKLNSIDVLWIENGEFKRLQYIKQKDIVNRLICFEDDFAILIVDKKPGINFPPILVSDNFEDQDLTFFSWGIFQANLNQLHFFKWERNDSEMKRFKSIDQNLTPEYLLGLSGAGIFHAEKSVLLGIIYQFPNKDFQNQTIDCVKLSFSEINDRLLQLGRIALETKESKQTRIINRLAIRIHDAPINGVMLDLELARKRMKTDIEDDWFYDPLKYIDLLNQDYLFKQFESYFNGEIYTASTAEKYFVPKKQFTHRLALVTPFRDRIMYMATVGVIAQKLDNALLHNVYSARYNSYSDKQLILNGVEQWKKMQYKLSELSNEKDENENFIYGCVIEIDILNFYDNIYHSLLYDKIKRVCETTNEKNAATLLLNIINRISDTEKGLPQNSDASSLLASFYLNQVDTFMSQRTSAYYRFMDDIRIFCKDKYEARKLLKLFEFELRRCFLSVNSQKTRILSFSKEPDKSESIQEIPRNYYNNIFDAELSKISRLRKSANYGYLNEAFHLSLKIIEHDLNIVDINNSEDSARRVNYALNTIALLAKKGINLNSQDSSFEMCIEKSIYCLTDKPWITPQVCKILNLLPTDKIKPSYFNIIKNIVLNEDYNIYSFQTYQLWLLLANHKYACRTLATFAVDQIEKNDDTNRPVIASMVIYICAIDKGYRRVILRKFNDGFTQKRYFQNRLALIALRSFDSDLVKISQTHASLSNAHEFLSKFGTKDLVFVEGADEDESENELEQRYSI